MKEQDYTQLAAYGYEAYCVSVGGKAFDGSPLKTWNELDETRQNGWEAFAEAVEKQVVINMSGAAEAAGLECQAACNQNMGNVSHTSSQEASSTSEQSEASSQQSEQQAA